MPTRVLVPSGVIGLGFDEAAFRNAVASGPDAIAIDAGSTDSGPFYLGSGTGKYATATTRAELRILMEARATAGVPLIIGSCGTCGTDRMVDWMADLVIQIAHDLGQSLRVAKLYASQTVADIAAAYESNAITALPGAPDVSTDRIAECTNIVALAGIEQIQAALATSADIVLAGRTTDTAIIAALPIARGEDRASAWHGAKIAECGALCSTNPTSGVIEVTFDTDSFTVTPWARGAHCTPHSVSAHMLYENSDPQRLHEPGGLLDVSGATYVALDDARVRVAGAKWTNAPYAVKLEGARLAGFQTMLLALLRDPRYVENATLWADRLQNFLKRKIAAQLGTSNHVVEIRLIGQNATLGARETGTAVPNEIGVLVIVTAPTQDEAEDIGRLINPFLLHFPLTEDEELPTFAFPLSPAQTPRGPVYEFVLHHALHLNDPMDAFRIEVQDIG